MTKQNVVVYTSEDSIQCEKLKAQLDDWKVNYEEKNVSLNREHIKELQRARVYGTPAVFIDDYQILGFQKYKLKQVLGIGRGYYSYSKKRNSL